MITPYKFIQQDTSIDLLREICIALEVISNQLAGAEKATDNANITISGNVLPLVNFDGTPNSEE